MSSSRTAALLSNLHSPHTTGIPSFCLYSCSTRSFSAYHVTSPKRSTRPRTRHSPISGSTIAFFSTSTRCQAREPNHYEVLDLPVTATAGEIKKQFYALSLRHHPDRNRKDPSASSRFARISSAYNVLGNAQKRSTYDREHGFHHAQHRTPGTHQHPMGSHSSYSANLHNKGSYAGSRPASGLSKRRGPFRGPPPSFYAQGGYGATGRTAEGSWTAGAGEANQAASGGGGFASSSSSSSSATGGQKKGSAGQYDPEDPTGFIDRNPLGHFDARGHFRTQSAEDARRRERRVRARRSAIKEEEIPRKEGIGVIHFVVVGGMLAFASFTAALFTSPSTSATPAGPVVSRSGSSSASSSAGGRSAEGNVGRRRRDETVSVSVT